jgi:hypothetical protein
MTDDEREAERVKMLASAVYREMSHARRSEDYVRTIVGKHGDHPAFTEYMREMCLTETLNEFVSRPALRIF